MSIATAPFATKNVSTRALAVGAAALVVVAAAAPPAPARRSAARPKTLAGTTLIKGATTSAVAVRLPQDARVQVRPPYGSSQGTPAPGVGIKGSGRVAGFYLTQPDVTNFGRTYLAAFQFRFCPDDGCSPSDRPYEYVYSSAYDAATGGEHKHPGAVRLPAGNYFLYLVSQGEPVEIELELQGLTGKTTVRPSSPVGSGLSIPTAENSTSVGDGRAFWYGHQARLEGEAGVYVGAMRLDVKDWSYLRLGLCISEGAAAVPREVRDAPYCPGGQGAAEERTEAVPVDREVIKPWVAFVNNEAGGEYAFGQHYTGLFTEATFDGVSSHLDVNPDSLR